MQPFNYFVNEKNEHGQDDLKLLDNRHEVIGAVSQIKDENLHNIAKHIGEFMPIGGVKMRI